jgi:uncharacterized protein (TIGR02271 family)
MSEDINLSAIEPGMPVYGPDGEPIGPVEAIDAAGIRVLNHAVPATAITRIDRDGVHLQLASAAFHAAPPMTTGVASTAEALAGATSDVALDRAHNERIVVPVTEERLVVGTRQMQIGEAQVTKRVVEEQVMVPVIVRREEVEIIRRAPGESREEIDDPSIVEIIRIPLRGEEPVITTQAVVTSEVVINRIVRAEEQQVTGTVRSTDVSVEEHLTEAYARLQPSFEEHFTRRQQLQRETGGATYRARAFQDAEPNYRAGFLAGSDERYAGRTFEEIGPALYPSDEPAERDPGMMEQIRDEVREGFARARATVAH